MGFSTKAFMAKILSWRFRYLNIVGCLFKRRPTKGGVSGTPGPPLPSYAPGLSVTTEHYALRRLAIIFKMAWSSEVSSYLFMSPEAIIRGNSENMFWQKLNHLACHLFDTCSWFLCSYSKRYNSGNFWTYNVLSVKYNILLINDSSCLEAT